MSNAVVNFIFALIQVLTFAIFGRAILSWFPGGSDNFIGRFVFEITEPVLAPLRRIIPMMGAFDITPIVAIILLQVIGQVASRLT
ncbi:MAG: YggT family protein [Chloroflexi bacterium]|nr:YggT family protein [Chloroflexota bacterium]